MNFYKTFILKLDTIKAQLFFLEVNTPDTYTLKLVGIDMIYTFDSPQKDGYRNASRFVIGSATKDVSVSIAGKTSFSREFSYNTTVIERSKGSEPFDVEIPVSIGSIITNRVGATIPMSDYNPIVVTVGKKGMQINIECAADEQHRIYYDFNITDGIIGSTYKIDEILEGYYDYAYSELAVYRTHSREIVLNELPYHERTYIEDGVSFPSNLRWSFWLRIMNTEDSSDMAEGSCYSEITDERLKVHVIGEAPEINQNGKAYATAKYYKPSTSSWVGINSPTGFDCTLTSDGFDMYLPIPAKDMTILAQDETLSFTSRVNISWDSYDKQTVPSHEAFFNTTRNMNFSNGLANNVFLGGTSSPNFTSRVWYSHVNKPLYFPDTNYIEVGSNDTAVMGLVKIGEYLGVVKQGDTTDSSIYIAYPTSYDEETTYAVKPSANGIGAYAKHCFNVLGDETLFLSKDGVMAIKPGTQTADEVKNRSYYIDGRLLKETNLDKAYSFVWKGFYLLAINDHVYLLDGSQHNSWGNDKTNLVYECYYWDNVPAKQFARIDQELWFSDGNNLCRFKTEEDDRPYNDDGEPIKAEWSTLFDDDGTASYFKTLQKKGSMLSLLPTLGGSSCDVYIKTDDGVPRQIGTANSDETDLPIDFYFNKKIKKYKRMQVIVRNEILDQGFGVEQITKLYTMGNYAK